jgi:molecular chaperone GrpE
MDKTPELPDDADAAFEAELAGLAMEEAEVDDALALAQAKATEHLGDLQRLQAEYVNYRKRVDRDRQLAGDMAAGKVIEALVPVLDDIAGARDHGELAGPFAAIADKLEATLARLGWSSYGAPGDPFDPAIHEALVSVVEPGLAVATVREVAQPGHRLGDRVLRPARVVVAQPE